MQKHRGQLKSVVDVIRLLHVVPDGECDEEDTLIYSAAVKLINTALLLNSSFARVGSLLGALSVPNRPMFAFVLVFTAYLSLTVCCFILVTFQLVSNQSELWKSGS